MFFLRTQRLARFLLLVSMLTFLFAHNFFLIQTTRAASFQVNATNDSDDGACNSGHCSLREAINASNANSDADTITFAIGAGGLQTINVLNTLPSITAPVTIDGTTQPGFTNAPLINLNGNSSAQYGLIFATTGANSSLRGLIINHFEIAEVFIGSTDHITIAGNYLGTNTDGTAGDGSLNGEGIIVQDTNDITIGGLTPSDRNIISGSDAYGIYMSNGINNKIQGNYIGTDVTGTVLIGNLDDGINLFGGSNTMIGGATASAGNLIAGNEDNGVILRNSVNNTVSSNLIRNNSGAGVSITGNTAQGNYVVWNSISGNGGLGIDLGDNGVSANDAGDSDTGPNSLHNFPVITSAVSNGTTLGITGTLDSTGLTNFTLHLYAQSTCDASGYGEGSIYLGSTTLFNDGTNSFSFTGPSPLNGAVVTATASNMSTSSTSEFSACANVTGSVTYVVNTTTDTNDGLCDAIHCSLREAITAANAHAGADGIEFAIGTGAQTIALGSALPNIGATVTIDGTTQPGFSGAPLIEIVGPSSSTNSGFTFGPGSDNSGLSGLILNRFTYNTAIYVGANNITITGNYIGTNAAGTAASPNPSGIVIAGSGTIIGGTTASARNIISGNTFDAIGFAPGTNTATIQGNYIGTDVTGTVAIGNGRDGISIFSTSGVIVGGTGTGEANIIRNNVGDGVVVTGTSSSIQIQGNQISNNGDLGIDLNDDGVTANDANDSDTGPNGLQNFPVLASAVNSGGTTTVTGTAETDNVAATLTLDFYAQAACDTIGGYGEGETYLGSLPTTSGTSFSFNAGNVAAGQFITATVTNDLTSQTSEFSACYLVTTPQTATVALTTASDDIVEGGTYIPVVVLTTSDGQDLINAITVDVVNLGTGTAGAGDHNFATTTITFNAGSNSGFGQGFGLETVDDTLDENDETLIVGLSNVTGTGASIGTPDSFTLTITDNDTQTTTVQFSSSGYTTTDESGTTYDVAVSLTTSDGNPLVNAITVDASDLATGSAASGSDYNFSATTLTFSAGSADGSTQNATIGVTADTLDEGDETVDLGLGSLTGTNASLGSQTTYTLTITDDDTQTATVQFSSAGTSTPDETGTTYDVAVALTTADGNPLVNAITVDVSDLGSGTAGAGDYSFSTTTLTFPAGSADGSTQNATIGVTADTLDEGDETVALGLGSLTGTNASLGSQTTYTLTITDDDVQTATVQFSSAGFTTPDESNNDYNIDVVLTTSDGQPLLNQVVVDVSDLGTSTATLGTDYNYSAATLFFDPGTASGSTQTPNFAVSSDTLDEPDETADFGLDSLTGTNASLGAQTTHTVTITDDDAAIIPSVTVSRARLRMHAGDTRSYTVVLDVQPTGDVTITVSQPERCVVRPRTLIFTPANWNTPQTVTVRARNFPDTRCRIRHTATGGSYDGVVINAVLVRILSPAWEG